jgi:hypothetical protein
MVNASSSAPQRKIGAMAKVPPSPPVQVYLSHSPKDLKLVQEFRAQVDLTRLPAQISYDLDIPGGASDTQLARQLELSKIALFFLSPAALASKTTWEVEVPTALRLAQAGRMHVVPVLLRECAWQQTPLAQFTPLPHDGQPLDKARPRALAWQLLIHELRLLLDRMPEAAANPAASLPAGADRLLLALCAVLDQPAELALLEHLDESELGAVWQLQLSAAEGDAQRALAQMAQRHGQPVPHPLWAAWMATVQPGKLGP